MRVALGIVLIVLYSAANAVEVILLRHNQTSGSGAISTLITDGSHTQGQPASDAIFDWDGSTLTSTGLYSATSSLGSSIYAPTILNDQITNLSITTGGTPGGTASATSYACVEGTFLSGVGANGCGDYTLGGNFLDDSTTVWTGLTVSQTIGGDDVAGTGGPRTIAAFDLGYDGFSGTDGFSDGDVLFIGNGIALGGTGALGGGELMTFRVPGGIVDDSVVAAGNTTANIQVLANDNVFDDIVDLTVTDSTNGITPVVLKNNSVVCTPEPNPGTPPPVFIPDPDCFPSLKAELSIEYTSAPGFSGTDTFTYTVTDAFGPAMTGTVTVSNQLPVAVNDNEVTPVNTPVVVDVLGNDTLGDGPQVAVAEVAQPVNGAVVVTGSPDTQPGANIVVTYTPPLNFGGVDTFDYTLTDDNGDTDTATVSITVGDALAALDDSAATEIATPVLIDVLANDANTNIPNFSVDVTTPPTKGAVTTILPVICTLPTDCSLSYTPNGGEVGDDTFVYSVTDNSLNFDSATVTVFINDVPVANDDSSGVELPAKIFTGVQTALDVQGNDTGLSDTPITITVTSGPADGAVDLNANPGMVTYTSNAGFVGQDMFTYTLTDSRGNPNPDTSGPATVTVDVDDEPVANDNGMAGNPAFMVEEGTTLSLDVLANDTGLSDTPLTVTLVAPNAALGTPVVTGSPGDASSIRIDYTAGTTLGEDVFGYQIQDNSGETSTADVYVAVFDADIPMAFDDAATTDAEVQVSVNVLANDTGLADEPLTVTITTNPANGSIGALTGCIAQSPCQVPYTSNPGFAGTDTFQYMVTDSTPDNSNIATVSITVNAGEQLRAVLDEVTTFTGETIVINVLANDLGLGNPPLSVTKAADPFHGTVDPTIVGCVQEGGSCEVSYTPDTGYVGSDSFQYKVQDNNGNTSTATVAVTITAGPAAFPDHAETTGTKPVTINVLANDTGLDSTPLVVTRTSSPAEGTAVVQTDNTILYTPPATVQVTTETFEYTVTDFNGRSASAIVTVEVGEQAASQFKDSTTSLGPVGLGLLAMVPWLRRRRRD